MYTSRPRSASQNSHHSRASNKPVLQRKWKERSGNHSVVDDRQVKNNWQDDAKSVRSQTSSKRRSNSVIIEPSCCFDQDKQFRTSFGKLSKFNFSHHDPEICVCSECLCGRHLCKMHAIAPDLTKNSSYKRDYPKKKAIPNQVFIETGYGKLEGPNLNLSSTKANDFTPKKNDDLSRPKPEDMLKTGGPCPKQTSYTAGFPGYRGDNQYVKPTDKHTRGYFPLRGRTSYNSCFKGEPKKKDDWDGIQDNLKCGADWFGDTTYGQSFRSPNPQAYPIHVKNVPKLEVNPDDKNQFQTSYKNDFVNRGNNVCPAKVLLETRGKGIFRDSMGKFSENSDYKAMDPNFQAISRGKFSYVQP